MWNSTGCTIGPWCTHSTQMTAVMQEEAELPQNSTSSPQFTDWPGLKAAERSNRRNKVVVHISLPREDHSSGKRRPQFCVNTSPESWLKIVSFLQKHLWAAPYPSPPWSIGDTEVVVKCLRVQGEGLVFCRSGHTRTTFKTMGTVSLWEDPCGQLLPTCTNRPECTKDKWTSGVWNGVVGMAL